MCDTSSDVWVVNIRQGHTQYWNRTVNYGKTENLDDWILRKIHYLFPPVKVTRKLEASLLNMLQKILSVNNNKTTNESWKWLINIRSRLEDFLINTMFHRVCPTTPNQSKYRIVTKKHKTAHQTRIYKKASQIPERK